MFQLQLNMILITIVLCLFHKMIPQKIYERIFSLSIIVILIIAGYLLIRFRIMQFIGIGVLAFTLITLMVGVRMQMTREYIG